MTGPVRDTPTARESLALVAALMNAQRNRDSTGMLDLLDTLSTEELRAGLRCAASLAASVYERRPGGLDLFLSTLHDTDPGA
jgi:uncharacterized protein YjgD (DUF1641 family)